MATTWQLLLLDEDVCCEGPSGETKAPLRFLIVDDDAAAREMIAQQLRDEGFTVRAVTTAGAGVDAVADWRADVVLVDYRMPFVSGLGFLYRRLAPAAASSTSIALISGGSEIDGALAAECATLEAAVYVTPLGPDGLHKVGATLLTSTGARLH